MAAALRRRGRLLAVIAVLVLLLVVGAVAVASWVFSSKLLEPDHGLGPYDIEVERMEVRDAASDEYTITFKRDETTSRRGIYGLDYPDGHAIAREIRAATGGEVTRRVTDVRGSLDDGDNVAFDEQVFEGNPLHPAGSRTGRSPFARSSDRCPRGIRTASAEHGRSLSTATTPRGAKACASCRRFGAPGCRPC